MSDKFGLNKDLIRWIDDFVYRSLLRISAVYTLVGILFLLLTAPILLSFEFNITSGSFAHKILITWFNFAYLTVHLFILGSSIIVVWWLYKRVVANWKRFRPPYTEGELIIEVPEGGTGIAQTIQRQNALTIAALVLNIIYLGILLLILRLIDAYRSDIVVIIETIRKTFNTQGFESFLSNIFNINFNSLSQFGLGEISSYVAIIVGGTFAILIVLNLDYLLRRWIVKLDETMGRGISPWRSVYLSFKEGYEEYKLIVSPLSDVAYEVIFGKSAPDFWATLVLLAILVLISRGILFILI